MSEWKAINIEDFSTVIRGASPRPKGDPRFYGGPVPRLMVEDVTRDGKFVTPKVDFLTIEGAKRSRPCPAGTLTIVCSGTVGIPSFLSVDACIHDGFLALINIDESVNRDFLYYQLVELKSELDRTATHGGIFTNLTTSIIKKTKLSLPPLPQQKKIAEILGTVDAQIEATEELIRKYEMVKEGLMQDLFTRGIDPKTGKLRPPVDVAPELYKESVLGWIPGDWEVKRFNCITSSSAFGPRFPGSDYSEMGNVATMRTTDLDLNGNIDYSGMPLAKLELSSYSNHLLLPNDLLITRSGTCGIACVFKNFTLPVLPGAFLIRFRLDTDKACTEYFKNYFNHAFGKRQLKVIAEGGVQKNIRASSVLNLVVKIPSVEEQNAIQNKTDQIENLIDQQGIFLKTLKSLKQGLMQDLLTGKREVKV
jgi:type I restriction enzyme S subunit